MTTKIDYEEITKLVKFLEEKNLTQFELEVQGFKIKIARGVVAPPPAPAQPVHAAGLQPGPSASSSAASGAARPADAASDLQFAISPMVGTFYRAPDPSSSPYVEIGEEVKKGQTLCIIEAMKLMNEIESEVDGTIEEIFVQNGKPVEFGQKLFSIKPLL